MIGSSVVGVGTVSLGVTFSTDTLRGLTLFAAAVTFGVEGVVFGVTFALGSDFILAEPLGFNTFAMSLWLAIFDDKEKHDPFKWLLTVSLGLLCSFKISSASSSVGTVTSAEEFSKAADAIEVSN